MGDAAIALSTKIHTLRVAVQRLEKDISDLDAEISAKAEMVDECIAEKPPRALILENEEIGFRLIASLDAFLYEARSEYEMLRTFALMFTRHILKKRCNEAEAERILKQAMLDAGHHSGWIEDLRKNRAAFFHQTAPWFAMQLTRRDPRRYELLILSENVADLEKNPSYVKFETYRQIWLGLGNCAADLHRWALAKLDEFR